MKRNHAINLSAHLSIKAFRSEFGEDTPIDTGEDWWDEAFATDAQAGGLLEQWADDDDLIEEWRTAVAHKAGEWK